MSELIFTSHYSAARRLLATDLGILNHGQVMRTRLELGNPSPNFHTTPTVGRLSLDIFDVHRPPLNGRSRIELLTHRPRVRYLDTRLLGQ
ncbi:hypothetical protein TNCV_2519461 [Trichonephila clavipes]|nr:hypothetical protein TNCV_2519461 [Trichonephila clavipes]